MKVLLSEIENTFAPDVLEEAQELVSATTEYDITQVEEGYFHCISRQPEYHVEITIRKDGVAIPKCHCTVFKRSRNCKHAIAALLLLRDQILRNNRSRKKSTQEHHVMDEVLRKLNVTQLRSFLASYAFSHAAFRAEILSHYLHLLKYPDYHQFYMDIAPIDKYGQVRLNRNSIKTVRGVTATLLKQSQQLLMDHVLSESLRILEASFLHLHRLWSKLPQFQEQVVVEMRMAYKIFESLCAQSMAPRLQVRVINLALEICAREGYTFPTGMKPLMAIVEPFLLEEKTRKTAFSLAEKKFQSGHTQQIQWASLLYRWKRLWSMNMSNSKMNKQLEKLLPSVILENNQHGRYEDVLYLIRQLKSEDYTDAVNKVSLQAGLISARILGDTESAITISYKLALTHLDMEAWNILWELDPVPAGRILNTIEDMYQPGHEPEADMLLLNGWKMSGNGIAIINRLKAMDQSVLLVEFDFMLKDKFRSALEDAYARHIISVKEDYGGVMARQKLNNIFSHLKAIDLFQSVAAKIKIMENAKHDEPVPEKAVIKGFVFDLDGVIVDTAVHHFQAWKKIMEELGIEIAESDDEHTRGAGRMESLEYLLDKYEVHLTEDEKLYWAARKNDLYVESINGITPSDLLPGVLSFLKSSRDLGLLLALGSASKNARPVIKKLGVEEYFDAILDGNDAKASKPDPEIFLNASRALGLDPSHVVVFEDAVKGVQAALAAGCYAVGIGDGRILSSAQIVIPGLDHYSPSDIIERLA